MKNLKNKFVGHNSNLYTAILQCAGARSSHTSPAKMRIKSDAFAGFTYKTLEDKLLQHTHLLRSLSVPDFIVLAGVCKVLEAPG